MFCENCGADLHDDWVKCPYCGKSINKENFVHAETYTENDTIPLNLRVSNQVGMVPHDKKSKKTFVLIFILVVLIGAFSINKIFKITHSSKKATVTISQNLINEYNSRELQNPVYSEDNADEDTISSEALENSEMSISNQWDDIDLLDYNCNLRALVKKFPNYISEIDENSYGDAEGYIDIRSNENDVIQYVMLSGLKSKSPYLAGISIGMDFSDAREKIDQRYKLLENDCSGDVFYNSQDNSYITTYIDSDNGEIFIITYMTKEFMMGNTDYGEHTSYDEYILPESNSRYLIDKELWDLSQEEIQMAINEIYARHGCIFNTEYIQKYFESKSWYYGRISINDFDTNNFNEYEEENLNLLIQYRK